MNETRKDLPNNDFTFEDKTNAIEKAKEWLDDALQSLREYQNTPHASHVSAPASMSHAAPVDARDGGELLNTASQTDNESRYALMVDGKITFDGTSEEFDKHVSQTGAEAIEIGDIVQFFAASHPLNEPTEYIGRVERDYKGLHAANRYLPITGVRIIEKGTKNESNN